MVAKKDFDGEILHFGAVRYRLTGSGIFRSELRSLSEVITESLPNITMQSATAREPTILAKFNQQRAFLFAQTTDIDEILNVSKIVIYIKPTFTGYPTE